MKTEKVFALIFLLTLIGKLLHVSGSDFLLVISLSTLALLYFPFSFYFFSHENIRNQNLPLSILAGLILSVIPVGLLFKLQYWPGSMMLLLYGLVPAVILLVIIFLQKRKQPHLLPYYQNMWIRTWILVILAAGFYLVPMSTQIRLQHWDDPQLARLKYRSYSNPENEAYRQALVEYIDKKAQ